MNIQKINKIFSGNNPTHPPEFQSLHSTKHITKIETVYDLLLRQLEIALEIIPRNKY